MSYNYSSNWRHHYMDGMTYAAFGLPRKSNFSLGMFTARHRFAAQQDRRYLASVIYRASDIIHEAITKRERSERVILVNLERTRQAPVDVYVNHSCERTRAARIWRNRVRMHAYVSTETAREGLVYEALERIQRDEVVKNLASVLERLNDH